MKLTIKTYGRMPLSLRLLKLFHKKRIYDPYEVLRQIDNIAEKGYELNFEKIWYPEKLREYQQKHIQVVS